MKSSSAGSRIYEEYISSSTAAYVRRWTNDNSSPITT